MFASSATAVLALVGALSIGSAASAAPEPSSSPAAPASITGTTISPTPSSDGFVPTNTLAVSGTATADSTISISVASGTELCSTKADSDGHWTCASVLVPNGPQDLTIVETDAAGVELDRVTQRLRVLGPPTIAGPTLGIGVVNGTGFPNSRIRLTATGPDTVTVDSAQCSRVSADGAWSCLLSAPGGGRLPSGTYQLRAQQGDPTNTDHWSRSTTRTVTIDTENPAPPVVATPTAEARVLALPATFAGSGEHGATVHVFVSSQPAAVCTATVIDGAWSCTASGIPDGTWLVQALQWDAAGNPGPSSPAISVGFGAAPIAPVPAPGTVPEPQPAPGPSPETPVPSPSPPDIAQPPYDPYWPDLDPGAAPDRGEVPAVLTWGTPTGFGWFIPTPAEAAERGNWAVAPLLGLAFVLLVGLPSRLMMRLLAGTPVHRRLRLTGRNRTLAARTDDTPLVRPWVVVGGSVLGAAVLAAFTIEILPESRYLRLLAAIIGGILLLNLAMALAARSAAGALKAHIWFRLVPSFLIVAAVATLLSRAFNVHPPIILGVIIAATIPFTVARRQRGLIALAQLLTLLVVAVLAWFGVAAIGRDDGFWSSMTSELLTTVCLAGIGSAVMFTLPVRALPGRILFAWSPWVWAAVTFVIVTVGAVVLLAGTPGLVIGAVAVPALFTAVVLAAWVWRRYVQTAS